MAKACSTAESNRFLELFLKQKERWEQAGLSFSGPVLLCDGEGRLLHAVGWDDFITNGRTREALSLDGSAVDVCRNTGTPAVIPPIRHRDESLRAYYSVAVPVKNESVTLGIVGGLACDEKEAKTFLEKLEAFAMLLASEWLRLRAKYFNARLQATQERMNMEARKKDLLFQAAKRLHSRMEVKSVLTEVVKMLHEYLPHAQCELYLTQESQNFRSNVKPLTFDGVTRGICIRAYVEGKTVIECEKPGQIPCTIAVPLAGRQGIYGVILADFTTTYDATDLRFICKFADLAGTAFENARLYEQARHHIQELRLINEITKNLNQSLKINEILNFALKEMLNIFKADYCCIVRLEEKQWTAYSTNLPVISGPLNFQEDVLCKKMVQTKEPIIISDYGSRPGEPSSFMELAGCRSLIGAPMIADGNVAGVILIAQREAEYFSLDDCRLLFALSGYIGLAIVNASLHSEVQKLADTDSLTGLYARHYLNEQVLLSQKKDDRGTLIVIDLDRFKEINDTYGHLVGDRVLVQVSRIIGSCIRETDVAARWGGEEIAVYLPQVSIEQGLYVAERIRNRVFLETDPEVTVSIGVSAWSRDDGNLSVDALFHRADEAMYRAKKEGRNQIRLG